MQTDEQDLIDTVAAMERRGAKVTRYHVDPSGRWHRIAGWNESQRRLSESQRNGDGGRAIFAGPVRPAHVSPLLVKVIVGAIVAFVLGLLTIPLLALLLEAP